MVYDVGDKVMLYVVPPREKPSGLQDPDAESKAWKQKHKPRFVGPAEVMKKISRAWYLVKVVASGKRYKRHVSTLSRYHIASGSSGFIST